MDEVVSFPRFQVTKCQLDSAVQYIYTRCAVCENCKNC